MEQFHFCPFNHCQIPKKKKAQKVETEKKMVQFHCSLCSYTEPSALVNISEHSEGKISQLVSALPHYLLIGFCLLPPVSINMMYCHTYSRLSDDIF